MDPTGHSLSRREMLLATIAGVATACAPRDVRRNTTAQGAPLELILCGADEVFVLALPSAPGSGDPPGRRIWSWRAADCPDIPEPLKRNFRSTDDCKPIDGGRRILISSSSGAIALVERETGRALFHAQVINAHSVEMLPKERIAAAASVGTAPGANRVVIFDISGRELVSDPLNSAHGVVWDENRSLLWALGNDELRAYRLGERKIAQGDFKPEFQFKLPDSNGHDLSPVPGTSLLFISTGEHCWYFDRDTRKISPHELLADTSDIKSYSVHPVTGRIAYVQAEGGNWWAQRVHFLKPSGVLYLPGQRLYKARWGQTASASHQIGRLML